jgi:hypothetical protein
MSRFKGLKEAVQARLQDEQVELPQQSDELEDSSNNSQDESLTQQNGASPILPISEIQPLPTVPNQNKRGRPSGKRSDPSFFLASAYIPVSLHHQVKIALLKEGKEYSQLIHELLENWLKHHS